MLGAIVDRQLKALDFSIFKVAVADELEIIKADIMEEIRQSNHGCSAAELVITSERNAGLQNTLFTVSYAYIRE